MVDVYDLMFFVGYGSIALIFAFAAYWAFSIRRVLAVGIYRRQALGICLVALILALILLSGIPLAFLPAAGQVFSLLPIFAFGAIFYWIDASVLEARRSDPLLRYTFHWKQLRIALWVLDISALVSIVAIEVATGGNPGGQAVDIIFNLPFYITVLSGVTLIPVAAVRSKDMILRRHLVWFALFAGIIAVSSSIASFVLVDYWQVLLTSVLGLYLGAFCLYRSSKSLVPLKEKVLNRPGTW
ncbi:MAG: hypothetical protein ACLQEQ_04520 [Nitrososphaerales archaeon]